MAGNWITTGDHPGRSLVQPFLWPVAGMDLLLLATAAVALLTARSLGRPRRDPGRRHAPAASLPGKGGAASHDR